MASTTPPEAPAVAAEDETGTKTNPFTVASGKTSKKRRSLMTRCAGVEEEYDALILARTGSASGSEEEKKGDEVPSASFVPAQPPGFRAIQAAKAKLRAKRAQEVAKARQAAATSATQVVKADEWDAYVRMDVPVCDDDIIGFWDDHAEQFPILSELARKYLCIQLTSVPCEQLFSTARFIGNDYRSRLTSEHFMQSVMIKKNVWML